MCYRPVKRCNESLFAHTLYSELCFLKTAEPDEKIIKSFSQSEFHKQFLFNISNFLLLFLEALIYFILFYLNLILILDLQQFLVTINWSWSLFG